MKNTFVIVLLVIFSLSLSGQDTELQEKSKKVVLSSIVKGIEELGPEASAEIKGLMDNLISKTGAAATQSISPFNLIMSFKTVGSTNVGESTETQTQVTINLSVVNRISQKEESKLELTKVSSKGEVITAVIDVMLQLNEDNSVSKMISEGRQNLYLSSAQDCDGFMNNVLMRSQEIDETLSLTAFAYLPNECSQIAEQSKTEAATKILDDKAAINLEELINHINNKADVELVERLTKELLTTNLGRDGVNSFLQQYEEEDAYKEVLSSAMQNAQKPLEGEELVEAAINTIQFEDEEYFQRLLELYSRDIWLAGLE